MKLVIPVAGIGARLRPHTITKPKPLLPVAGKPILAHILDMLDGIKFTEVIFIVGHLKEKVEEFVKKNYKFKTRFIEQKSMDGTAGAIHLVKNYIDEDFLIIYADTVFDADLSILKKIRKEKDIDGLMWVKHVEDYQRFGVIVTNADGHIGRIIEKPKDPISKLANIGVYYIKNYKLLFEGIDYVFRNDIKVNGEFFLTDAFSYMIDHGSKLKIAETDGWYDCGKFETLLDTNKILLKKIKKFPKVRGNNVIIQPSYVDPDAKITNSIIGPYVSISKGCEINQAIIENSIIDSNSKISNIIVKDSVLGESTKITGQSKGLYIGDYSEI